MGNIRAKGAVNCFTTVDESKSSTTDDGIKHIRDNNATTPGKRAFEFLKLKAFWNTRHKM